MEPLPFAGGRYVEAGARCRRLWTRAQFRPMSRQAVDRRDLPSPSERDAAMRCDFRISSVCYVPGADLDAKNSSGAGIEGVPLPEPAGHEGGFDEKPENRFR